MSIDKKALSSSQLAVPFVKATKKILSTMAGIEATVGRPYIKKLNNSDDVISAIVVISGDKQGSIAVSFSKSCAAAIVEGMLGDDIGEMNQEMQDAVGEVTNMVSGQARAGIQELGLTLQGSTPYVTLGDSLTVEKQKNDTHIVAIPFSTSSGDFTVEFSIE